MASFTIVDTHGLPVRNKQVIINALGERAYGITDENGYVFIPITASKGKIIVGGQTVYFGNLDLDAIRIGH